MASALAFQAEDEGSIPFTYSIIMESWCKRCARWTENPKVLVQLKEVPLNVNIGQGLGKWPENRNQEVPLEAQTRILTRTDFTELISREQVGGMRVDYFTFKCRYSTVVSALACQAEDASSILVIYSKIIRGSSEAK